MGDILDNYAKKVLVVSHERSGTHFFINSLILNFGFNKGCIDVYAKDSLNLNDKKKLKYINKVHGFFDKNYKSKTNLIYKSHHQSGFFEDILLELRKFYNVFYVVRDPRDTLVSCFHYFHNAGVKAFPLAGSVKELIFDVRPYAYPFDGAYSLVRSDNFINRWIAHVSGWMKYRQEIEVVLYTELKNSFADTMQDVGGVLSRESISPPVVPGLNQNTVCPRKGVEGDWRLHLSDEDNSRLCSRVFDAGLEEFLVLE